MTQKAIKGYVIVEHLAHLSLPIFDEINLEFLDEDLMIVHGPRDLVWSLYFDGAMNMRKKRNRSSTLISRRCDNPSSLSTYFSRYK